jgi:hypothetical protein
VEWLKWYSHWRGPGFKLQYYWKKVTGNLAKQILQSYNMATQGYSTNRWVLWLSSGIPSIQIGISILSNYQTLLNYWKFLCVCVCVFMSDKVSLLLPTLVSSSRSSCFSL